MNSKEAVEKLLNSPTVKIRHGSYLDIEFIKLIKQDLDRLEQLEDNIKIHKETIKMQYNQIEKLKKENKKLKEDRKDILQDFDKLEKVIEILKRFNFTMYTIKHNNNETEFKIYTDCLLETQELTQEEYELLKEYLYDK